MLVNNPSGSISLINYLCPPLLNLKGPSKVRDIHESATEKRYKNEAFSLGSRDTKSSRDQPGIQRGTRLGLCFRTPFFFRP